MCLDFEELNVEIRGQARIMAVLTDFTWPWRKCAGNRVREGSHYHRRN